MIEHPEITKTNKLGYPDPEKIYGVDLNGNEVFEGDSIVFLPNGEFILEDDLEDYLIEMMGFEFKTAK